jgi:hypothetical protein
MASSCADSVPYADVVDVASFRFPASSYLLTPSALINSILVGLVIS